MRRSTARMVPGLLAGLLAGVIALGGCAGPANEQRPGPTTATGTPTAAGTPTAPATGTPRAYAVATRVLDLRDPSRPTGTTPGRALPTSLWYPETGQGPFPVVVFGHGLRFDPGAYSALLSGWASAGFVVAAPTFPLTSRTSPGVAGDLADQPADVSFVLTRVLALDTTAGDALRGRIDERHVAVAGHSLGAMTAVGLLVSGSDPRITAAILLSGSTQGFGSHITVPVPVLVLHGTADDQIPLSAGQALYAALPGPKAFVELPGGTHVSPYQAASDPHFPAVLAVTTDFLRFALDGQARAAVALRTDADRPGVARLADDRLTG